MRKLSTREQMAYRTIATLELESDALRQRLTVAEQLLSRALQYGGMTPDWRDSVEEALKPAA